jgi:hypothetical protein
VTKSSAPRRKRDPVPTVVVIEMTPKLYQATKEQYLKQLNPLARTHISTYFDWLKSIRPQDVIDAVELNKSIHQAYRQLGANPLRVGIAIVRAFLKTHPQYAKELQKAANLDLALTTLKFENPQTYAVIKRYGDRGTKIVQEWIKGALEILGAIPPVKGEPKK